MQQSYELHPDKLHLEKIKRKAFLKLNIPKEISDLVELEVVVSKGLGNTPVTISMLTQLFVETTVEREKVEVPATWFSHLLLTLSKFRLFSSLKQFVKYTSIIVVTELCKVDPMFTAKFGKILEEAGQNIEVEN